MYNEPKIHAYMFEIASSGSDRNISVLQEHTNWKLLRYHNSNIIFLFPLYLDNFSPDIRFVFTTKLTERIMFFSLLTPYLLAVFHFKWLPLGSLIHCIIYFISLTSYVITVHRSFVCLFILRKLL